MDAKCVQIINVEYLFVVIQKIKYAASFTFILNGPKNGEAYKRTLH
jgi:hypothetical protein